MKMQEVRVQKVTVNIGIGGKSEALERAMTLLERATGQRPVPTRARERNPTWRIKIGDKIGTKVTLRGEAAANFLKRALSAVGNKLSAKAFDEWGNFSFGVREYIDIPGLRYDPVIGMLGMDVAVTLAKPGLRVALRRRGRSRIARRQRVSKAEAIAFAQALGATIE